MKKILGSCICCGKDIENLGSDWPDVYPNKANTIELDLTGHPIVHGTYGSTTLDCSTARITDAELFTEVFNKLSIDPDEHLYVCDDCYNKYKDTKFFGFDENFFKPRLCLNDSKGIKLAVSPDVKWNHLYQSVPREVFAFSYDNDGPDFIVREMKKFGPFAFNSHNSGIEYDKENDEIRFYFRMNRSSESEVHSFTLRKNQYLVVYSFYEYEVIHNDNFFRRFMRTFPDNF